MEINNYYRNYQSLIFIILYIICTIRYTAVNTEAVAIKTNQLDPEVEDVKSQLSNTEFTKNCPAGSFHHTPTGSCVHCDCVKDDATASDKFKKYYESNCLNLVIKCQRQFQFYDEDISTCRNCTEVCDENKDPNICKIKCPGERCCSDTEIYSPHLGSCKSCSEICEDDQPESRVYCATNCRNYNYHKNNEENLSVTTKNTSNSTYTFSTKVLLSISTEPSATSSSFAGIMLILAAIFIVMLVVILIVCLRREEIVRFLRSYFPRRDEPDERVDPSRDERNVEQMELLDNQPSERPAPEISENLTEAVQESDADANTTVMLEVLHNRENIDDVKI